MTYESYLNILEERLNGRLHGTESVCRVQVLKNNGVKLDGFSYHVEGHKEQPTVYVNNYYREEMSGEEIEEVARLVLKVQRESRLIPGQALEDILNYPKMKSMVYYRLISQERNKELLKQVPWLPWLDLAIVFYVRIPGDIVENATALIHTIHMEHWGIPIQELYRAAAENMAKVPVRMEPMEEFLEDFGFGMLHSGMQVLSSGNREYGAAVIVDPNVLRQCFQRLGEDYYILPSSIHEVILLPVSRTAGRESLDMMIQEVNQKCVSREEYLSDHAYRYCAKDEKVEY